MKYFARAAAGATLLLFSIGVALCEPLASWNEGPAKAAVMGFVQRVTDPAGKDFVPPEKRVAAFDNDGTLWVEQPMYVQLAFALDRVRDLAPKHPEWRSNPALKAAVDGDLKALAASGEKGLIDLVAVTHAGMTPEEFQAIVADWLAKARHPRFKKPYTQLVYQPMLELLAYLRENGFTTYIVSGGGVEFMRSWMENVYRILPAQVVGSSIKTRFEMVDGKPALVRQPELNFIDDGAGPPPARDRASASSFITPTPSGNTPMTEPPRSAISTRRSTPRRPQAGPSST